LAMTAEYCGGVPRADCTGVGGDENKSHGVNEVWLKQGRIVREGWHTTVSDLRSGKDWPSWRSAGCRSVETVAVYRRTRGSEARLLLAPCLPRTTSGPFLGCAVNADTGKPVIVNENHLTTAEFENAKIAETIATWGDKSCRPFHSPGWQRIENQRSGSGEHGILISQHEQRAKASSLSTLASNFDCEPNHRLKNAGIVFCYSAENTLKHASRSSRRVNSSLTSSASRGKQSRRTCHERIIRLCGASLVSASFFAVNETNNPLTIT